MPELAEVVTPVRYAQGFTYEGYLDSIGENKARFAPHEAAFKLAPEDVQFFKDIVKSAGGIKVLAIGEDWCPDVHRGLPIVNRIAIASGMELRFFPRDKNTDIMNLFLKEGKYQSIPVFAFFDNDLKPLCHWIERPASASRAMNEMRAELSKQKLSEDETRAAMRQRQAPLVEGFRQETVRELKELLAQAVKKR